MKPEIDLSIVILSFNTRQLLRAALASVFKSRLDHNQLEVIVCDNGSTDGSVTMVKKDFPQVVVIANGRNLGFAAGNNTGIRRARGRYILLLNSDTEVSSTAIAQMLKFMDQNPLVGAATCKLVLANGAMDPACHRGFPTPWVALTYFLGLEGLFPRSQWFGGYHQGYKDLSQIHEVDIISGAFFLVRREVVKQVGLLDEDYFFYGEDMDWAFRIRRAGWKIMFNPHIRVLHHKKQSGRAHADRVRRRQTQIYFYRYNKLFYQKNYAQSYPSWMMKLLYLVLDLRVFMLEKLRV